MSLAFLIVFGTRNGLTLCRKNAGVEKSSGTKNDNSRFVVEEKDRESGCWILLQNNS